MDVAATTGTVTLLFTDVEGATRLLRELGDGYADVIADHQRLLRGAFALHGGREIDTQGDAFFVAFDGAGEAVAAASDALRALAATQVRVRVGIHTGEPEAGERGYVGLAVHRAARICAAANGGQIVISQATRSVVGDGELSGAIIRDLGEHALKDFERAEHLYQVIVDGVAADLRPIRTLELQEAQPSPFGAAESDLAAALDDVLSPGRLSRQGREDSATFDLRTATARFVRSPFELAGVALLTILGIAVSAWLFIGAVVLAVGFVLRHAATEQRRIADAAGIHLYAMRALAPDPELAERIRELGALLVRAAHLVHDADEVLAATDRSVLAHRLLAARGSAVSATDARRVDALARAIESRDRLAECRGHLSSQVRGVEGRSEDLRTGLFEIRLGHQSRNRVLDELIGLHADTEDATIALRLALEQAPAPVKAQARHRGVFTIGQRSWDSKTPSETIADVKTRGGAPRRRRGF
jgi:class 3 adenylate cyclase